MILVTLLFPSYLSNVLCQFFFIWLVQTKFVPVLSISGRAIITKVWLSFMLNEVPKDVLYFTLLRIILVDI